MDPCWITYPPFLKQSFYKETYVEFYSVTKEKKRKRLCKRMKEKVYFASFD